MTAGATGIAEDPGIVAQKLPITTTEASFILGIFMTIVPTHAIHDFRVTTSEEPITSDQFRYSTASG